MECVNPARAHGCRLERAGADDTRPRRMAAEERSMRHSKHQQFTERLSTAASARRAMLEKFQAKRTVDDVNDPAARERRAAQEALRAARETRRGEREAARRAMQERLAAERLARKAADREQRLAHEEQRRAHEALRRPSGLSLKPLW